MKNLKKILLSLLLSIMLILSISYAEDLYNITFQWDANTESDLDGYRLYNSTTSGMYNIGDPNSYIDVDKNLTTYILNGFSGHTTYFVLTAYDTVGNESNISNEVIFDPNEVVPDKPKNFQILIIIKQN